MDEFRCEQCDFVGKNQLSLKTHIRFKHKAKVVTTPEATKNYVEFPDNAKISVSPVKEPTIGDATFDPFKKFKTDPEHYYYRALNVRPTNLRMREAQGFETIPGSEFGDLVLGRMPIQQKESLDSKELRKMKAQQAAPKEEFKQKAEEAGIKTFEE